MSPDSSGISWTDGTLDSLYGCAECSVGYRLCYAVDRVYRHSCNPKLSGDRRFDGLVEKRMDASRANCSSIRGTYMQY